MGRLCLTPVALVTLCLICITDCQNWNCGSVYITVSSIGPGRNIELNWNMDCQNPPDTISLFDKNPLVYPGRRPITKIRTSEHPTAYYKTNIEVADEPLPGGWSWNHTGTREHGSHCLPHWVASYTGNRLIESVCLRIQPTWMSDNRHHIGHLPLTSMFIPGTHNSACDEMRTVSKRHSPIVERWGLTQDQDIWNQLVFGIRYLDLRVGYYPKTKAPGEDEDDRFWINHSFLQIRTLKPVLKSIAAFAKASDDEVIIVDFHRFPTGFNGRNGPIIHRKLINLIKKELGDKAINRPEYESQITYSQILNTTKRIIISYNQDNLVQEMPWLWKSVRQMWGNKQETEDLKDYLQLVFEPEETQSNPMKGKLWAAMAELTHQLSDIFDSGSLRIMADSVNRQLGRWFYENNKWIENANIVATDYFLGNNIINIAIESNLNTTRVVGLADDDDDDDDDDGDSSSR